MSTRQTVAQSSLLPLRPMSVVAGTRPLFAQILPADRATTWNPGIPGGVPARDHGLRDAQRGVLRERILRGFAAHPGRDQRLPRRPGGPALGRHLQDQRSALNIAKGITLRGAGPGSRTLLERTPDSDTRRWPIGGDRSRQLGRATPPPRPTSPRRRQGRDVRDGGERRRVRGRARSSSSTKRLDPPATQRTAHHSAMIWLRPRAGSTPSAGAGSRRATWSCARPPGLRDHGDRRGSGNTVTFTTPFHIGFDTAPRPPSSPRYSRRS